MARQRRRSKPTRQPEQRERRPHYRPPPQGVRLELIALRQAKYPGMGQREFAAMLGITRLHMIAIEVGRRTPSLELALRWLALLAPKAHIRMFGSLPTVEKRLRLIKHLQSVSPKAA